MDTYSNLRNISEAFTGSPFRLELGVAIAGLPEDMDTFSNSDVAVLLADDFEQPTLSRNLQSLTKAGFLQKTARGVYSRLPSPFWRFVLQLDEGGIERSVRAGPVERVSPLDVTS